MHLGHRRILEVELLPMMDAGQLAHNLRECAEGRLSVRAFESWFDANSWNVHQSGDAQLVEAVFEFEELHSSYAAERLPERELRAALARLAASIEQPAVGAPGISYAPAQSSQSRR